MKGAMGLDYYLLFAIIAGTRSSALFLFIHVDRVNKVYY